MTGKISNEARLKHIIDAITEIESYISNVRQSDFYNNSMLRNATVKQLEIIGEASKHLSQSIKDKYNDLDWRDISSFRNILIHEYFVVDYSMVWDIINNDLPFLKEFATKILKEEFKN